VNAVEVNGLTRCCGALLAVAHVSFTVISLEIFGFLGPNGAGKSTTVSGGLTGYVAPDEGTASLDSHDIVTENRLRLIAQLRDGEQCVCDLSEAIGASQPLLSFHLKTLKDAGLVTDRREGRWVYYTLHSSIWSCEEALMLSPVLITGCQQFGNSRRTSRVQSHARSPSRP
jgi:DNA-binding transcriptional ArsR family regulator